MTDSWSQRICSIILHSFCLTDLVIYVEIHLKKIKALDTGSFPTFLKTWIILGKLNGRWTMLWTTDETRELKELRAHQVSP